MKPTQFELFPVPSPCIGVCTTNAKGYCLGCFRSRNERFNWNDMTPVQKMRVIDLCKKRKEIVEQKRREKAHKQQEKEQQKKAQETNR